MNNEQFRRLLASNASAKPTSDSNPIGPSGGVLGSRKHANIPMTPRTVKGSSSGGVDFARQLAERNGAGAAGSSAKKFRSAAPKGSRLAAGYRDRTGERVDDGDGDEKAARIKALEEQVKLGQMEREMFERIRDEVTGGEVRNTHLVKGLDWKLLERIKKGEDVLTEKEEEEDGEGEEDPEDLDDEFEELEKKEVVAVRKEEKEKKGEMAPPPPVAGMKRTRDQILAELKASRKRAAEEVAAQQQLGTKFRRIGGKKETSRIEIDERGREVLIVTDVDGHEKRKVRKGRPDGATAQSTLLMPDKDAKPLGMEVPEIPDAPAEESDDDIYADIGDDYDPLAGIGEDELSSSDGEEEEASPKIPERPKNILEEAEQSSKPDAEEKDQSTAEAPNPSIALPRNYFNDDPSSLSVLGNASNPFKDPTYLAALLQKSKDTSLSTDPPSSLTAETDEDRLKRRAAMLSAKDRDMDDVDMGFGSSRFDDADDMAMDGSRIKLSEWGEKGDDDDGGREKGDKGPRKRGPKKRKGDKNSVVDVLGAIQRRKK
jgi:RED-like protein N-terminal region